MTELLRRKHVDFLVEQFWRKGYLTLSRRFGIYLPEPNSVGGFDVDVVARQKNKFAIGLTLTEDDLKDTNSLLRKIKYLATRHTRHGNFPVLLFIGAKQENYFEIKLLIEKLDGDVQKNIRLFQITENHPISKRRTVQKFQPLFS